VRDQVKFLLVDDNPENLTALEALLRRDELDILPAASGTEALELLLVHDIALALIDVQMPGMSGFELAELMRGTARTRQVPIILLTAGGSDAQRLFKGYEAGAVDYLVRPIEPHILRSKAEVFFRLDHQRRDLMRQRDSMEASEQRFRRSLMLAPTPVMLFDDIGAVLAVNAEWTACTGHDATTIPTVEAWTRQACGARVPEVLAGLHDIMRFRVERWRIELDVATVVSEILTWDMVFAAVGAGPDGRRIFVCLAHDVTKRASAERTRRLLLGELNHRVKNNLALVVAIAKQTLRQTPDPAAFIESFTGRIMALAGAHSLLSDEIWEGAEFHGLLRGQLSLGAADESRVLIEGPSARLDPQIALHTAMILHELFTNALKYGALSSPAGRVRVHWVIQAGRMILTWREEDGPAVATPRQQGFGSTLIERSAAASGGAATVSFDRDGVIWYLEVPLVASQAVGQPSADARQAPTPAAAAAPGQGLKGKRFLVIEDDVMIALDIATTLEDWGGIVIGPAGSCAEALARLSDSPQPDAALLDGNLQGEPATPIAQVLRQRRIPFAFLTGYGRDSLSSVFCDVPLLGKPFTTEQLVQMASSLLSGSATAVRTEHAPLEQTPLIG